MSLRKHGTGQVLTEQPEAIEKEAVIPVAVVFTEADAAALGQENAAADSE